MLKILYPRYVSIVFFSSVVCISIGCTTSRSIDTSKIKEQAKNLSKANPRIDVARAVSKGDRRFVGIYGITVSIPGVPDGSANSIVLLHGVKTITGTSDAIAIPHQDQLRSAAIEYAKQYNKILLRIILDKPDNKTRKLLAYVKKEISILEYSDPLQDSLRAVKAEKARFIIISGEGILGVPNGGMDLTVQQSGTRLLKSNSLLLNVPDKKRFQNILKRYVIPYNKNLYVLLKNRLIKQIN